jgi:hypothetical protein
MLNMIESRVVQRTWRAVGTADHLRTSRRRFRRASGFPVRRSGGTARAADHGASGEPIGTRIATELDQRGMPGAVSQLDTYDAWYPGYIDTMPMYQNINAVDNAGRNCARHDQHGRQPPRDYRRASPDVVVRQSVGRRNVDPGATPSTTWSSRTSRRQLRGEVQAGACTIGIRRPGNTIQPIRTSAPYAYIIPQAQHDPSAPVELLRRMAFMGVESNNSTAT